MKFPRATRLVIGFESREDAERTMEALVKRMAEYGLNLHPEKTRLIDFEEPDRTQSGGKGPATFDFLGFTLMWERGRSGRWRVAMKTRKARLRRALKALGEFCRSHRHYRLKQQHASLTRRLEGHFNYFGVNGVRSRTTLPVASAGTFPVQSEGFATGLCPSCGLIGTI